MYLFLCVEVRLVLTFDVCCIVILPVKRLSCSLSIVIFTGMFVLEGVFKGVIGIRFWL